MKTISVENEIIFYLTDTKANLTLGCCQSTTRWWSRWCSRQSRRRRAPELAAGSDLFLLGRHWQNPAAVSARSRKRSRLNSTSNFGAKARAWWTEEPTRRSRSRRRYRSSCRSSLGRSRNRNWNRKQPDRAAEKFRTVLHSRRNFPGKLRSGRNGFERMKKNSGKTGKKIPREAVIVRFCKFC